MRLPRNVSPAAARRSLLFDVAIGVAVCVGALVAAAGVGVVGFIALLCAAALMLWYLVEGALRAVHRRRR